MFDARAFFESRLDQYGDSPEALNWTERGQRLRFEILSQIGDLEGKSILDVGSGLGHFYEFLQRRLHSVRYLGCDISPRLVQRAREVHPDSKFEVLDILTEAIEGEYDFVLSSGIHNLENGSNEREMESILRGIWDACTLGAGVNMLSRWAGRQEKGRHFYNPVAVLRFARKLTPRVILRHDYLPHDFTLFMFRGPPD